MEDSKNKKIMSFAKQKEINEYIRTKKILKPIEIEQKFQLTKSTARRYLLKLEEEGYVKRPFGEIVYNEKRNYLDKIVIDEIKVNVEAKRSIARTAAVLAKDYLNIYLDAGSTCYYLLEYLDTDVNIFTNSIHNAMKAVEMGFKNIYVVGGKIKHKSLSTNSHDLSAIENFKFQIAFLGVSGIDENGKLTTTEIGDGKMKNFVAQHSELVVVLATEEKFGFGTFYDFTPSDKLVLVVTNYKKEKEFEGLNLIRTKDEY
ncbi:DeoR/GlpR family DNA-binding transcription regulator [Mycoplasma sp. AC157]